MRSNSTVRVLEQDTRQTGMQVVFVTADTLTDAPEVQDTWETGSVLWAVSDGKWYGLTSDGEWVEQHAETL